MIRKLARYELYKVLFSYKALILIIIFLTVKAAVLCVLPEIKDSRVKSSQKQYDKVLSKIHGERTPEKDAYIASIYLRYKTVLDSYIEKRNSYTNGAINKDEWEAYSKDYEQAKLYINAYGIFYEKEEAFKELKSFEDLPSAAYFYDYGWISAFTYMGFPDPVSFLLILLLAVKMICPETDSGGMSINLTTRYGRFPLFLSKTAALLLMLCAAAIISAALETVIFKARFALKESYWPIYSIPNYVKYPLRISLARGFLILTLTVIRAAGRFLRNNTDSFAVFNFA